jgi:gluconolactonase
MGSNGLTLDNEGRLTICQHGDRRVVRVEDDGKWTTLAAQHEGRRFNSPNDAVWDRDGNLYFTDPPYGLEGGISDPAREIPWLGVYRRDKSGRITMIVRDMTRPNGIALSPDHKTIYVNNSDPNKAVCMAYDIKWDGTLTNPRVFADMTPLVKQGGLKGLPDGLKVDKNGNLFATGPGGVLVFDPDGTHLGTINTGEATANCAFGGKDGSVLYMTADNYLCRVKTKTKGAGL